MVSYQSTLFERFFRLGKRPFSSGSTIPPAERQKRFKRTADALQKCGLWDIAMKTGDLIKRNTQLQRDIQRFKEEAAKFLKSVVANPQNRELMDSLSTGAPITLGHRVRLSSNYKGISVTSPAALVDIGCSKISDVNSCNSSTTSGYASVTEGSNKQSSPPTHQSKRR